MSRRRNPRGRWVIIRPVMDESDVKILAALRGLVACGAGLRASKNAVDEMLEAGRAAIELLNVDDALAFERDLRKAGVRVSWVSVSR